MRSSGVLMPITSLPSPYGVGTMGAAAREFVDFLSAGAQTYWQVLPVGPTSFGDSPYQSFSTFAGNPYLIDFDDLAEKGLLKSEEYQSIEWGSDPLLVDYGTLYRERFGVLSHAVDRLLARCPQDMLAWNDANRSWLDDYALFMALKFENEGRPWWEWDEALRLRRPAALDQAASKLAHEVAFWRGVQYLFFKQWDRMHDYANEHGVQIIGDMPIYVARDSSDVWASPSEFQLDENLDPVAVAGCPPDGFSATGQLWGNPLFNWDSMAKTGYAWWIERTRSQFKLFDVLRIDHFRGFDSYYAIPFGDKDACSGEWLEGPGIRLFRAINGALGKQPIIAEDLGFLTPSVHRLLKDSGYPGMKVLEFAFDSRDGGGRGYQPHNIPVNSIAYVGTHDNATAMGWLEDADPADVAYAREYLGLVEGEENWGLMRGIWSSPAEVAVVQMQDLLGLGAEGRINVPSTLGGNWCWRMEAGAATPELAERLAHLMDVYERTSEFCLEKAAADAEIQDEHALTEVAEEVAPETEPTERAAI